MDSRLSELKARLAEISDLHGALRLLAWDQQVMMPPQGAAMRAEQRATLSRIAHEKFIADEIGRLLEDLRPYAESLPYESDEASLIRVTRREYAKAHRVPAALSAEMTRAAARANAAWVEARAKSDFALFRPYLQRNVELKHEYIACFPPTAEPYDVLLDDFEPGMSTAEMRATLDALKQGLVPIIAAVAERADRVSDAYLYGHFPAEAQRAFSLSLLKRFGYSADAWRLDPTAHPFTSGTSANDVRLTTRYHEDFVSAALFASMHECGHGLHMNGLDPALERSSLAGIGSYGLGESQSRTWENFVGRSRPFWRFAYPHLQAAFPQALGAVEMETFYRAVNKIQPSFIRVEADEATYNLHIILRFELEQEILAGQIALADLPEAWNARMKAYLGIEVPDDAHGVLQDVHWAVGYLGYFPTYSLGNIAAAQLWEAARRAIPDLDEQFARGEFTPLREWQREQIHRHGAKFTLNELLPRVTGGPLSVEPLVRHLYQKAQDVYGPESLPGAPPA